MSAILNLYNMLRLLAQFRENKAVSMMIIYKYKAIKSSI